jgi:hypothetical protein
MSGRGQMKVYVFGPFDPECRVVLARTIAEAKRVSRRGGREVPGWIVPLRPRRKSGVVQEATDRELEQEWKDAGVARPALKQPVGAGGASERARVSKPGGRAARRGAAEAAP